jgi:hypothetical protein
VTASISAASSASRLEEFGADSLEFKLYAFIDLNKGGGTGTDLRIAILDAFDDAGIRSPLPRTGVTLRNIDSLRGMAAEYASAGSNGRTSATGNHASHRFPEHDDKSVERATHLRRNGKPVSA